MNIKAQQTIRFIGMIAAAAAIGCGGAQAGGSSSDSSANKSSSGGGVQEEADYYMGQAGMALSEGDDQGAMEYYLEAARVYDKTGRRVRCVRTDLSPLHRQLQGKGRHSPQQHGYDLQGNGEEGQGAQLLGKSPPNLQRGASGIPKPDQYGDNRAESERYGRGVLTYFSRLSSRGGGSGDEYSQPPLS
jgi:hypothetical protein